MREFKNINEMTDRELLDWYATFVKAWHYEAVNEFAFLKNAPWSRDDIEEAILKRMKGN